MFLSTNNEICLWWLEGTLQRTLGGTREGRAHR
jgi:hypothetical protein